MKQTTLKEKIESFLRSDVDSELGEELIKTARWNKAIYAEDFVCGIKLQRNNPNFEEVKKKFLKLNSHPKILFAIKEREDNYLFICGNDEKPWRSIVENMILCFTETQRRSFLCSFFNVDFCEIVDCSFWHENYSGYTSKYTIDLRYESIMSRLYDFAKLHNFRVWKGLYVTIIYEYDYLISAFKQSLYV